MVVIGWVNAFAPAIMMNRVMIVRRWRWWVEDNIGIGVGVGVGVVGGGILILILILMVSGQRILRVVCWKRLEEVVGRRTDAFRLSVDLKPYAWNLKRTQNLNVVSKSVHIIWRKLKHTNQPIPQIPNPTQKQHYTITTTTDDDRRRQRQSQ